MTDSIPPVFTTAPHPAPPPFDTPAMQIAQAQAQAAANHTSEVTFLQQIADANDASNADVLVSDNTSPPATDDFLSNGLLNLDPAVDSTIDPTADPTLLSLFNEFGTELSVGTSDSVKSQQLHDLGVLQKDAAALEAAANESSHLPLTANATTVDLSVQAQGIVEDDAFTNGPPAPTPAQLAQISAIIQPLADEAFTPALLLQLQAQLAAAGNPILLNFNTIALALNGIAGMQPSPNHEAAVGVSQEDEEVVAPVSAIDRVAIEDSAIR